MNLRDYNTALETWDFEKGNLQEFLEMLSRRNLLIRNNTCPVDFKPEVQESAKNTVTINPEGNQRLEEIAFHVGFPHQTRLHVLTHSFTGAPNNLGVFFSMLPKDVPNFIDPDCPSQMVYLLDMRKAKEVKLQINYPSPVISRYDLDSLDFSSLDAETKKREHCKLNNEWVRKNTKDFSIDNLKRYKEEHKDWILVPAPIEVSYPDI